ncbi:MAG: NAD-dependent aldehyde dehydrogenase [Acidimicrobiales bacterium]|nr:NAD-dependent aldehyde dehydrogenase [Acidimicrobiales bacterium]
MTDASVTTSHLIPEIVEALREAQRAGALRTLDSRRVQLRQLQRMLVEQEEPILRAMADDLGKPPMEAYAAEIGLVLGEISEALKRLDEWCAPERVKVQLAFKPGTAEIVPESLGVVLIIAPWNYPIQLLLAPLVPALAAGNTVVLKPSEVAPATANLLADIVPQYMDASVVTLVKGGVDETTALLAEQFDHIFYTGNGTVGRIVMTAAAQHLTPVTLELGGKSPAIVAADADIEVAARRIAWGKFLNAGQTCVAPDYVLVDATVEDAFMGAMLRAVHDFYGDDPVASADYGRIVNTRHWDRLTALLDDGGYESTICGGHGDRDARYLPPTVLAGVKPDAALMQQEIFGPILPVLTVGDVDEAIRFVNDRDKPLALYIFSGSDDTVDKVIARTSAGGVCVNHAVLQVAVGSLPFGGVGASGMGSYHGKTGFDTFTHRKPVLRKPTKPDPSIMYPPYKGWKFKLVRRFL